jgi:Ca-activated chloride channel family protein
MAAPEFNDDRKDAGDIGAGHSVTALYQIVPVGKAIDAPLDDLKYQQPAEQAAPAADEVLSNELLTVKLRYKLPEANESTKLEFPLAIDGDKPAEASKDLQWSAAVAAFAMLLRESQYKGDANFDMIQELAKAGGTDDPSGRRAEFMDLVRLAKALCSP